MFMQEALTVPNSILLTVSLLSVFSPSCSLRSLGDLSQKTTGQGFLFSYSAEERTGKEARCQMQKKNWKNVLISDQSCSRIKRHSTEDSGWAPGTARQARLQIQLLTADCARESSVSPEGNRARPRHDQNGSQTTALHAQGPEGHTSCHTSASSPTRGYKELYALPSV